MIPLVVIIFILVIIVPILFIIPSLHLEAVGYLLMLRPGDYDGWVYYAKALMARNRISRAHSVLEHAILLNPSKPQAWILLGNVYERMNLPDKAAFSYKQAEGSD